MRKYFYTDGKTKFGPFLIDELKDKNLTRESLVWYLGLQAWTSISELEELDEVVKTIPPPIVKSTDPHIVSQSIPELPDNLDRTKTILKKRKSVGLNRVIIGLLIVVSSLATLLYFKNYESKDEELYNEIVNSSFDGDEDFNFYIDKFYRDTEVHGLFPKKPSTTIIKFAKLDMISDATHIHAISYGIYDDDLIEIYINPSTWKKFNKPKRYYLIYHELAHDVLNVEDLSNSELNIGKLMYPEIASYERITMDDFIEASHELFEEISGQSNN
jgi:hypothetical protein